MLRCSEYTFDLILLKQPLWHFLIGWTPLWRIPASSLFEKASNFTQEEAEAESGPRQFIQWHQPTGKKVIHLSSILFNTNHLRQSFLCEKAIQPEWHVKNHVFKVEKQRISDSKHLQ